MEKEVPSVQSIGEAIKGSRKEYRSATLDDDKVLSHPADQFHRWFNDVVSAGVLEPNAMCLSTCDGDGNVSSRIVLMKGFDNQGVTFFTNYQSKKARNILSNNKAALNFFWPQLERQVRIQGIISKVDAPRSDEYFQSRPRSAQLAALASRQSEEAQARKVIDERFYDIQSQSEGKELVRPETWGGFILTATYFEFWQGRESRMHDRIQYKLEGDLWKQTRLWP